MKWYKKISDNVLHRLMGCNKWTSLFLFLCNSRQNLLLWKRNISLIRNIFYEPNTLLVKIPYYRFYKSLTQWRQLGQVLSLRYLHYIHVRICTYKYLINTCNSMVITSMVIVILLICCTCNFHNMIYGWPCILWELYMQCSIICICIVST